MISAPQPLQHFRQACHHRGILYHVQHGALLVAALDEETPASDGQDGILDDRFDWLIEHLGELVCVGMGSTNDTIVHIMKAEKLCRPNCRYMKMDSPPALLLQEDFLRM